MYAFLAPIYLGWTGIAFGIMVHAVLVTLGFFVSKRPWHTWRMLNLNGYSNTEIYATVFYTILVATSTPTMLWLYYGDSILNNASLGQLLPCIIQLAVGLCVTEIIFTPCHMALHYYWPKLHKMHHCSL